MNGACATLATPRAPGAIAIIQIDGDVNAALHRLGIAPLLVGQRRLDNLCGVDRGIVARWSESCVQLMPHGGPAVVRGVLEAIEAGGIPVAGDPSWPESDDGVEAMALSAIAGASSPAAIDLLLAQPGRWRNWDGMAPTPGEVDRHSRVFNRLLMAPRVVAVGRPNIGKSALCNALAGRGAALVADAPGVTRDHVGVSLRLGAAQDAVEIRWIDTPGLTEGIPTDSIDAAARESALEMIRAADCVALCGDRASSFVAIDEIPVASGTPIIRVGLRSDLGELEGADVLTCVLSGRGLDELAGLLRECLFPSASMQWEGPWRFDPALTAP